MSIPEHLLAILVCPVTKQPLQLLSDEQLAKLNAKIARGKVQSGGAKVENPVEESLITTDAKTIYLIDGGIPQLLAEQGIPTDQLDL